jgi:hypothetical protein
MRRSSLFFKKIAYALCILNARQISVTERNEINCENRTGEARTTPTPSVVEGVGVQNTEPLEAHYPTRPLELMAQSRKNSSTTAESRPQHHSPGAAEDRARRSPEDAQTSKLHTFILQVFQCVIHTLALRYVIDEPHHNHKNILPRPHKQVHRTTFAYEFVKK